MDSGTKPMPELSPRAGIARMTLELRALLQQAEELEAQDTPLDLVAARRQLRERLEPLMAERRAERARELELARADAEAAWRDATEQAAANAARSAATVAEPHVPSPVEPTDFTPAEPVAVAEPAPPVEIVAPTAVVDTTPPTPVVVPSAAPASEVTPPVVPASPSHALAPLPPPPPVQVTIDAEAFARVFATVFASMLQQRDALQQPGPQWVPYHTPVYQPVVTPKPSFWSHARHPDVLLLGIATSIVLVVLFAWLG